MTSASTNGVRAGETEAQIRAVLESLVQERQDLRRNGGDQAALEANRLAIVYWQRALAERITLVPRSDTAR